LESDARRRTITGGEGEMSNAICWFRGIWRTLLNFPGYPISGHTMQALDKTNLHLRCMTCGKEIHCE
jgi:hypothetical protein